MVRLPESEPAVIVRVITLVAVLAPTLSKTTLPLSSSRLGNVNVPLMKVVGGPADSNVPAPSIADDG
jgi:hypothetical protein